MYQPEGCKLVVTKELPVIVEGTQYWNRAEDMWIPDFNIGAKPIEGIQYAIPVTQKKAKKWLMSPDRANFPVATLANEQQNTKTDKTTLP